MNDEDLRFSGTLVAVAGGCIAIFAAGLAVCDYYRVALHVGIVGGLSIVAGLVLIGRARASASRKMRVRGNLVWFCCECGERVEFTAWVCPGCGCAHKMADAASIYGSGRTKPMLE